MDKKIQEIIKQFRKEFTRRSKNPEDKGKYRDDWFVRETTSKELIAFLKQALTKAYEAGQKSREKELEPIIEVAEAIADGSAFSKENGLIWQHWIDESKKRVESLSLTKESK